MSYCWVAKTIFVTLRSHSYLINIYIKDANGTLGTVQYINPPYLPYISA